MMVLLVGVAELGAVVYQCKTPCSPAVGMQGLPLLLLLVLPLWLSSRAGPT